MCGGAGDHWLTGGNGNDEFVFAAGFGNDRIVDFHTTPSARITWTSLPSA